MTVNPPMWLRWLLAFALCIAAYGSRAAELAVAVASNFSAPMKVIALGFEKDTGHRITLAFGATGQFYAQIRSGAPFGVLLAADDETPRKLALEGLGPKESQFTYARGRLVLWSKTPSLIQPNAEILRSGRFNKIAIANPRLAPYGAAAMEVIDKLGLNAQMLPKIVQGANITQAFQFVASGNADIGFVALSQVIENGAIKEGSGWVIPSAMHRPIRQDALLLNPGIKNPAAHELLSYLRSEKAKRVMRLFGYEHQD